MEDLVKFSMFDRKNQSPRFLSTITLLAFKSDSDSMGLYFVDVGRGSPFVNELIQPLYLSLCFFFDMLMNLGRF